MSWLLASAPGLMVAALFAGLLLLLRRFFDPVPWRVAAVFGLLVAALFGSVLFLGRVLLPLDLLADSSPWKDLPPISARALPLQWDLIQDQAAFRAEHRRQVARGEWPLFNPRVGAGEPFLGNASAQHGHPLVLLSDLLPARAAPAMLAASKVLLCLVFTFLLLRRWGVAEPAALGGALAYGLSGFVFVQLGWVHTHSAAALPLLLYGVERAVVLRGPRDRALLGVATGWALLGGHPETIVYTLIAGSIVGVARWSSTSEGLPWPRRLDRAGALVAAATLGGMLAAPIVGPIVFRLDDSQRATLNRVRIANIRSGVQSDGVTPRERLGRFVRRAIPVAAPLAQGSERFGPSWGHASYFQEGTAFVGSATLLSALLGVAAVRRRSWFPGERSALLLAGLGLLFFTQPPGLVRLMVEVPILRMSGSENRRMALLMCFGLAVVAACAWDRVMRHGLRRDAGVAAAGCLLVVVGWSYLAHGHPENPPPAERVRLGYLLLQTSVIAGFAVALLTRPGGLGGRRRVLVWLFPVLAAGELVLFHAPLSPGMPASHFFPDRPSIDFLRRNLGTHRMVGIDGAFRPAYPLVTGLADLRSSSPLQPASFQAAIAPLRASRFSQRFVVADHPLLDLLSVRYAVTVPGVELAPPLRAVFRGNLTVWERPAPINLVFLPNGARLPDGSGWRQLHEVQSFRQRVVVDHIPETAVAGDAPRAWRSARPRENRVLSLEQTPARIRVTARLAAPALLASSLFQDGGWQVLVDGRRVERARVNGLFVGAWLPAGEHRVDLVYRPRGFVSGCLLASLAIVAWVAWSARAVRPQAHDRRWRIGGDGAEVAQWKADRDEGGPR
ncbi:MAG TPA: YfhO family protein [Thermoanaerobaculia bacterium]|nr:YfhO family protein [Thermoanaerobaculia bacterium]